MAEIRQLVNGSTPTGLILVGTPPKAVNLIFDTGSDVLVVKSWNTLKRIVDRADGGIQDDIMSNGMLYESNRSTSYRAKYDTKEGKKVPKRSFIRYGSGMAITQDGLDTVHLTTASGQQAVTALNKIAAPLEEGENRTQVQTELLSKEKADILASLKDPSTKAEGFPVSEIMVDSLSPMHTKEAISGILGLQHMKNKSMGESLFTRLRSEGAMTGFGYCRHDKTDSGTFIWNDKARDGKASPVIGQIHWAVKLANVQVNTSQATFCKKTGCAAIMDTGSNIIAGPVSALREMVKTMGIRRDCSNFDRLPGVQLQVGNTVAKLPASSFVIQIEAPMMDPAVGADGEPQAGGEGGEEGGGQGGGEDSQEAAAGFFRGAPSGFATHNDLRALLSRSARPAPKNGKAEEPTKTKSNKICLPAVIPLDLTTDHGPLWVIGTPLFASYYARWSWPQGQDAPEMFFREVDQADACKQQAPASKAAGQQGGGGLIRREAKMPEGPRQQHIDEIRVPHWAQHVSQL